MTPAVNIVRRAGVEFTIHPYEHDPNSQAYGLEAAEKLGVPPERVFKTLVVRIERTRLCVAIIPVTGSLNLKRLAHVAGVKKADMATVEAAERATGYVRGGMSPLGQKAKLATYVDVSAVAFPSIYVSAGKRGLDMELSPHDLLRLTGAREADLVGDRG